MILPYEYLKMETEGNKITITIKDKKTGKIYTGISRCHPEDTFSEYRGGRYAETRAHIALLKDRWKVAKAECVAVENYLKGCLECKAMDRKSPTAKVMFRQFNIRAREVDRLADKINMMECALNAGIQGDSVISKALQRKRSPQDK